jgi:hypothetical protein
VSQAVQVDRLGRPGSTIGASISLIDTASAARRRDHAFTLSSPRRGCRRDDVPVDSERELF